MRRAGSMQRLDLVREPVVLVTDDLRVEGTVHMEPGRARFSDSWEGFLRDRRPFVPVTDATITYRKGDRSTKSVDTFLLERADVRAAFRQGPDEAPEGSPAGRIERRGVRAGVLCESLRVEGTIHVDPSRNRFSEGWEALVKDSRTCMPITDARILDPDDGAVLAETGFVSVDKGAILCGYPLEDDDHEAAPTRYIPLEGVRAGLFLSGLNVRGTLHVKAGEPNFSRFSDLWDVLIRDPRTFVALTDAVIETLEGRTVVEQTPFLCVDKAHVRGAYPLEDG